jgi:4-hydroxythreonine-4-phosphate dehydrogenase
MNLPRLAISIGDPNGVGPEIALRAHTEITKRCRPVYCADPALMTQAAALLGSALPEDLEMMPPELPVTIIAGTVSADAGRYSHASFLKAVEMTVSGAAEAVVTLPIHKEAWMRAGITFKGHTDLLRDYFQKEAIMMLGCPELYVALFTEHIPLRSVAAKIEKAALTRFLVDFYRSTGFDDIAVLGLNPHAGDNGVLGNEEETIAAAIDAANSAVCEAFKCNGRPFFGPVVPDTAFTPAFRARHRHIVAMYHDQGLAPLKALYFDESVNISLNLPIIRTSVDHGTAFDIAYRGKAKLTSYINAVDAAVDLLSIK